MWNNYAMREQKKNMSNYEKQVQKLTSKFRLRELQYLDEDEEDFGNKVRRFDIY